ncbi:LemA family protein [Crocinitomicaceae bacterium]|nr:LemA family protein [Crocinitomicaceae bacterium]MDB3907370.1 LemA family protein [Crocinitomicaceae bacterium]
MFWILVFGGLVLFVLITIWVIYNRLVQAENQVDEALALIDVQLKKRFELIPNLVQVVKAYNAHEADVLEKVVAQRSSIPEPTGAKANFDGSITGVLKNFRMQVEAYPDLLANQQFSKLMDSLSTVEDELAMARRYYNGTVRDLSNKKEVFPNVLFASMFGIKDKSFYEIDPTDAERPEIELTS